MSATSVLPLCKKLLEDKALIISVHKGVADSGSASRGTLQMGKRQSNEMDFLSSQSAGEALKQGPKYLRYVFMLLLSHGNYLSSSLFLILSIKKDYME